MSILSTIAASRALASGTNSARLPRRRAAGAVDLYFNFVRIDAVNCSGINFGEHRREVGRETAAGEDQKIRRAGVSAKATQCLTGTTALGVLPSSTSCRSTQV